MRDHMQKMQEEMQAFVAYVQKEVLNRPPVDQERIQNAMVRIAPPYLIRTQRPSGR
jgi:hypothetical protein